MTTSRCGHGRRHLPGSHRAGPSIQALCTSAQNGIFAYQLHGSVHHTLERESGNSIRWQPDLGVQFFDGHQGLATDRRSEGKPFPTSTLIAGGFKLDQLLVEPFQSLYATLVRHAYEADAILIGGYGFSDPHINRALQNRMKCAAERREPRPPLM